MRKLFFIASLILILSGCQKKLDLKLLIWEGFAPNVALDEFKKQMLQKHNIEVSFDVKFPFDEDDFEKKLTSKEVDLASVSHYIFRHPDYRLIERKLISKIDLSKLPNYENVFTPFKEFTFLREGGAVYGVPLENSTYRLIYNKKTIPEKPKSWKLLWDSKFAGKYSLSEYYFETNFYITALISGIERDKIFDIDYVIANPLFNKNLIYLATHARKYFDDLEEPSDISGSLLSTAFGNFIHKLSPDEEWEFTDPIEGEPGSMDFWVIGKRAETSSLREKIIYEWINFTLSEFYQRTVIMEKNGEMPVISKFEKPLTPYQTKRFRFGDIKYYKEKRFLWPGRSRAAIEKMRNIWNEALKKRVKN